MSSFHTIQVASVAFFVFLVIAVAIGGTVFDTIYETLDGIRSKFSVEEYINLLGSTIPASSAFYVNYIFLQAFVALPVEMLQIWPLILVHLRMKFW